MTTYGAIKNINSRDQNRNLIWNPYQEDTHHAWDDNSWSTATTSDKRVFIFPAWNVSSNNHGTGFVQVTYDTPFGSGTPGYYGHRIYNQTSNFTPGSSSHVAYHTAFTFKDVLAQDPYLGTSNASPMTLSFWVRCTHAGDYIAELQQSPFWDANLNQVKKHCSQSYTITTANTWQKVEITFPPYTFQHNDPWVGVEKLYFQLNFWLTAGSNYTSGTLATSWADITNANRAVGISTGWATNQNAEWRLMFPQLECSPSATPFTVSPRKDYQICKSGSIKIATFGLCIDQAHQWDHSSYNTLAWFKNPWHTEWPTGLCDLGQRMTGSINHWNVNTSFEDKDDIGAMRWQYSDGGDSSNTDGAAIYVNCDHIRISAPASAGGGYVKTLVAWNENTFKMTSMKFFDLDPGWV